MKIPLDSQGDQPLYRQISDYLRHAIYAGALAPGTRLPSRRQLAADLRINRITVEHAYAELEAEGLTSTHVGSGSYVLPVQPLNPIQIAETGAAWPLWQEAVKTRSEAFTIPYTYSLYNTPAHPAPIYFNQAAGDLRQYPVDEFRKVLNAVIKRDGMAAFEYPDLYGYAPLRETITQVLASQGLITRPENILITAGSQQALALVSRILLTSGDAAIVENPTYTGMLDVFRSLDVRIIGAPVDQNGMQVESLEKLLQQYHPRMIYTTPNFQNPTGVSMSLQRRRELITLADRYNIPVLEDDYVGDLRYDGRMIPSLKSLDPGGRVIYVSTFSKLVMPGLRVGFLAADGPFLESMARYKRVTDLSTSSLLQRALEAYVTVGSYHAHLRRSILVYRKRRDAMLEAVKRHLPAGTRLETPAGGMFLWLGLPAGIDTDKLAQTAWEMGVTFAPGSRFFVDGEEGRSWMRLNFVANPPDEIEEGVLRLRKAINRPGKHAG
jgi:GntR family transcriptional regulator/MocR family aminotransferase